MFHNSNRYENHGQADPKQIMAIGENKDTNSLVFMIMMCMAIGAVTLPGHSAAPSDPPPSISIVLDGSQVTIEGQTESISHEEAITAMMAAAATKTNATHMNIQIRRGSDASAIRMLVNDRPEQIHTASLTE